MLCFFGIATKAPRHEGSWVYFAYFHIGFVFSFWLVAPDFRLPPLQIGFVLRQVSTTYIAVSLLGTIAYTHFLGNWLCFLKCLSQNAVLGTPYGERIPQHEMNWPIRLRSGHALFCIFRINRRDRGDRRDCFGLLFRESHFVSSILLTRRKRPRSLRGPQGRGNLLGHRRANWHPELLMS
jgi:hypothetical protein